MRSLQALLPGAFGLVLLMTGISASAQTSKNAGTNGQFTYVIVHGAWGGGWAFREVDRLLTSDGHNVYRPTLTGQGERSHIANTNIDLNLHIQDVVNVILWEDLHDVVLVGHSYGGMVITGVADRVPERLKHVIYLDAFVPNDGESVNDIRPGSLRFPIKDGSIVPVWIKGNEPLPHDVPHPAKTWSEPISLKQQKVAAKLPTTYILTVEKGGTLEQDEFYRSYERAKSRDWKTVIMEGGHNVQWSDPKGLVALLEGSPVR